MSAETRNARANLRRNTRIVSTGYAWPSDVVDNDAFFARCEFDITDDRAALEADTRMQTRRWCTPGENTWTLARDAVQMALDSGALEVLRKIVAETKARVDESSK